MPPRHSVYCDVCGEEAEIARLVIRNRHGTEWFMDLCEECREPIERGKGINLLRSSRYQRFQVLEVPRQPRRR